MPDRNFKKSKPIATITKLPKLGMDVKNLTTGFKHYYSHTLGRDKNCRSPHYAYEANQLFTLTDNKVEFNGKLQQLKPYSIGTTRDYSYGKDFDQANYLNKLPALNEEVLLKLLLTKRVEMIIGNPFIFNRLIGKKETDYQIKALEPYIAITPVYMALTKERADSEEIKQALEQLTKQLKASPYYQKLLDKYQLNLNHLDT